MTDLTARLSSHDDPRLYREADELMQEAAAEITRLRAELASARAAALEEAAVICAKLEWPGRNHSEYIQGQNDMSYKCAIVIRAAITKEGK